MTMDSTVLNLNTVRKTVPELRYDGSRKFTEWQSEAREKLRELLGMDRFERCEDKFNIEYKREETEYTEYRFTIQSEEGYFFPSTLRIPRSGIKTETGKLPLIICLQGHSSGAHISLGIPKYNGDVKSISGGDRDFVVRALKEGYAALALEQRNFGECTSNPKNGEKNDTTCYISAHTALMLGRTTVGERVWDVSRVIDAVEANFSDVIDTDCISLMGNSGGGTATYYTACLEPRIKAAMPSCAVCTWEHSIASMHHCACNFVPHIARYFDMGDLGGLIAPRPLVVVSGKDDPIFLKEGVDKSCELIESLYVAAGAQDSFAHVEGQEGHRFYADAAWPVFHKITGI